MSDRITGLLLLAFTTWYGVTAWYIPKSFFSDPLGSRAFPLAVAIFLVPLALYLLLRRVPHTSVWPGRASWPALLSTLAVFALYSLTMEPLGFIASTTLSFFLFALVFRAPPVRGLVAAVVATGVLYVLFGVLLELYLPIGRVFEGWFG